MGIISYVKEDLGKDNYKHYRQNWVGKLTTNSSKTPQPDIYSGIALDPIPHTIEIINDNDRFQIIADKIIKLRKKQNSPTPERMFYVTLVQVKK